MTLLISHALTFTCIEKGFPPLPSRLHNLAEDKPLVLSEFGVDSIREGAEARRDSRKSCRQASRWERQEQ